MQNYLLTYGNAVKIYGAGLVRILTILKQFQALEFGMIQKKKFIHGAATDAILTKKIQKPKERKTTALTAFLFINGFTITRTPKKKRLGKKLYDFLRKNIIFY